MKTAKWILFDYGGVIARDHLVEQETILADLFTTDIASIRNAVTERSLQGQAIRLDQISEEEFWMSVAERLTGQRMLPTDCTRLTALWASTCSLKAEVPELFRTYVRDGANLGIATNIDRYREVHLRAATAVIRERLHIFASWRLGAMKPNPSYFDATTQHIRGLSSTRVSILFFDDRQSHVDAAIAAGWEAHRFASLETVTAKVAHFCKSP